ncbi:MAG: DEAD/DEAH box helicase [Oscillospiraceae bacterium]|nr:DEAD/DEAH box helicase [Oscillospiraceae bacterium]
MREYRPHGYQRYVTDKMIELPYMGAWLDMGLGKTVCTLTALHELKYHRFCIRKALVIAPKNVAENTWTAEAAKWEHLQDLRLSVVLGTAKQRIAALRADADVYIINRENTQWLVKYYGREWPFDVVILDESTSFKNHQAKRFRALKAVRSRISRLIELTGTPSPKSLMDLWAQVYLLDGGERLGRTISVYREIYFVPDKRSRTTIFSYALKEGAEEAIYKQLSDICISMKSEDYLELPDRIDHDIPVVLDAKAAKAYQQLETNMLLEVGEEEIVTAASRATLTGKLLQLCNGAVYSEIGDVIPIHDCKMEVFLETLEQLQGQHVLVYYYFRHDRDRILAALEGTGRVVRVYKGAQEERDWNAGKIDVLLAQPASCGYGLNLQDGGHHIVWFGLTWSLEEYQQANKRLHRQGQKYPVIVHRLIVKGGMDEDVIKSLESKDASQDALIEALKARVDKARRIGS